MDSPLAAILSHHRINIVSSCTVGGRRRLGFSCRRSCDNIRLVNNALDNVLLFGAQGCGQGLIQLGLLLLEFCLFR